jgi:hypothetical protein
MGLYFLIQNHNSKNDTLQKVQEQDDAIFICQERN